MLEANKLAVGVVSAIAGQSRFKLTWTGKAGHAGTTPMVLRRDALAGAVEFTLAVEKLARGTAGLVATVGAMTVSPGGGERDSRWRGAHARCAARERCAAQGGAFTVTETGGRDWPEARAEGRVAAHAGQRGRGVFAGVGGATHAERGGGARDEPWP